MRGPVAAAGSSRRLRLETASRLRAGAAAFRPWVVWGSGALRGAPSAGGLRRERGGPGTPRLAAAKAAAGSEAGEDPLGPQGAALASAKKPAFKKRVCAASCKIGGSLCQGAQGSLGATGPATPRRGAVQAGQL